MAFNMIRGGGISRFRSLFAYPVTLSFMNMVGANCRTDRSTSSLSEIAEPFVHRDRDEDDAPMDWDKLAFQFTPADYMYTMNSSNQESFKPGKLCKYGNIELSPCATVLNYGQGLIEGTKAYRREDGGMFLFRPEQCGIRMKYGAERLCMEAPSVQQFVEALKQTSLANRRWIPPAGKGSLYIRPVLIGSGPVLGMAPSSEYTFYIYASPVGNYFKEGKTALNLYVETELHRAVRGGVGGVKSISNYAPVLKSIKNAKEEGFSDVLYLDAKDKNYIEELSTSNIFMVKGNVVATPQPTGTILEGITRKSILEIAQDLGYEVEERRISIDELIEAEEVFCTGTAAGVAPVGSITYKNRRIEYQEKADMVSKKLYSKLEGIQKGTIEDKKGWMVQIN